MMFRDGDGKSVITGCGLGFSLGWLWFPWLSAVWMPCVVWGNAVSGGGLALLLYLILGFPLGGLLAGACERARGSGGRLFSFVRRCGRHLCHGAAYALLVLLLLCQDSHPVCPSGNWSYLIPGAAATAYILTGIYWGARLLSLPSGSAPLAYFAAMNAAVVIGLVAPLLTLETLLLLWPHGVLAAWGMAEILVRMENRRVRIGGRPRKHAVEQSALFSVTPNRLWDIPRPSLLAFGLAFAFAAIGVTGGSTWALIGDSYAEPPLWVSGISFVVGAIIPVAIIRRFLDASQSRLFLSVVIAILSVATAILPAWSFVGTVVLSGITEGAISGLALFMLSGVTVENGVAVRLTGMIAGLCVLLMNGGWILGEWIAGFVGWNLSLIPALAAAWCLIRKPLAILRKQKNTFTGESRVSMSTVISAGDGSGENMVEPGTLAFTEEEMRLLELLAREELTNQEMADRLFVSRDTIRYHLKKLYAKTNTTNRDELLRHATRYFLNNPIPTEDTGNRPE